MDRTALTRHTVDEDPEVIPGSQIWIESHGRVWHDLHGVHSRMWDRGVRKEWREWRGDFVSSMRRMDIQLERYQLNDPDPGKVQNVADSFAVLCDMWNTA